MCATLTGTEQQTPNLDQIAAAADQTWQRLSEIIDRLAGHLPAGADPGGWTIRQLLSHLIGSWQRVPVHAAFFLSDDVTSVPNRIHDPYWIAEWEDAPLVAFRLAMETAYHGNKAFLAGLDPATLPIRRQTILGEFTLGDFLLLNYSEHLDRPHSGQLEAFVSR
jgi:hypothetical protein